MKKNFRRISAILLAAVMVLSICMTALAGENPGKSAKITINNAGNGTFEYVQIIKPNPKTTTGWEFADTQIEGIFTTAFGAQSGQEVLAALIASQKTAAENNTAVSSSALATALGNVLSTVTPLTAADANPFEVSSAGVYAIKGTETGYAYSPMAAYVSFGEYDTDTGIPTSLTDAQVEAKKAPTVITKTHNDDNGVVEIGRDVVYTVTSTVPFLPTTDTNRTYQIKDTITGAAYKTEENGTLKVTVTVGTTTLADQYVTVSNSSFTLDLEDLILKENNAASNKYANETLTLTYTATVTDVQINNKVRAGDGSNAGESKYGSSETNLYTGEITLTKTGENSAKLNGAKFVVYKKAEDGTTKIYAKFDSENKFAGWLTKDDNDNDIAEADALEKAKENPIVTAGEGDNQGKVRIQGLDLGTYYFKEVEAPEGYSINTTDSEAVLKLNRKDDRGMANAIQMAETSMTDTKLSALPSTGGIGTYLFTILGAVLMAVAAGVLFLKHRRKSE